MHHSFVYRGIRVDVSVENIRKGYGWRFDLGSGLIYREANESNCLTEALSLACVAAREEVDRRRRDPTTTSVR